MKLLCSLFFSLLLTAPNSFRDELMPERAAAKQYLADNQAVIARELGEAKTHRVFLTAIVFPEMVRYSIFKDFFETYALELAYVRYGKKAADFSIGRFQMKPSFVEKLEERVNNTGALNSKYNDINIFRDTTQSGKRKERLERLQSLEWQLRYLDCFYSLVSARFHNTEWSTQEEKLRFYATAYNHDFCAPKEEIEQWIDRKTFPYGTQYSGTQYAYSDVALSYYRDQIKEIIQSNNQ